MSNWESTGLPCPQPDCGSSDAYALDVDGNGYCFACETNTWAEKAAKIEYDPNLVHGTFQPLLKRGLTEKTCRRWNIQVGTYEGGPALLYGYVVEGRVVAQHIRLHAASSNKYRWVGDHKKVGLYGKHLWTSGKKVGDKFKSKLVITEGEGDAPVVDQVLENNYIACVSIMNGAQRAVKDIAADIEFVESFDQVVLMFDMDEPGQKAAVEVAEMLSPGKAHIAKLPEKDAGECHMAGKSGEIIKAIWDAARYAPDSIVSVADIYEEAIAPPVQGMDWMWPSLTRLTNGRRPGEVYGFGGGTSCGKTDLFTESMLHDMVNLKSTIGIISLEQPNVETVRRLAGKLVGLPLHRHSDDRDPSILRDAVSDIMNAGNLHMYKDGAPCDWPTLEAKIRYLVLGLGCEHIYLDHLTAIAASEQDERRGLDKIMKGVALQAQELKHTLNFISHLNTFDSTVHEEGARVNVRHFRGSAAIRYWANALFGIERNQTCDAKEDRQFATIRVLKNRDDSESVGESFYVKYDYTTCRLGETSERPSSAESSGCSFGPEEDAPF